MNKLILRDLLETYAGMAQAAASPEEAAIVYDDLMDILHKYRR